MITEQEKGAAIGQFAAALVNMDYSLRKMQEAGFVRRELKAQLNIVHNHVEKLMLASQKTFNMQDADAVNALSDVMGMATHLLLQMNPTQIEDSLKIMESYARLNEIEAKYPQAA